jgi:hypothetical protein
VSPERLKEIRERAARIGQARSLSLGPAVRDGRADKEVRSFAGRAELERHALSLVKRPEVN